jgi:hypothetical protein
VDFSPIALAKARAAAERRGLRSDQVTFVAGDLTAGRVPGVSGPFDLLVEPAFRIEGLEAPTRSRHIATYLMERLEATDD